MFSSTAAAAAAAVPMEVVDAMRTEFTTAAKVTQEMQIGMLRAANRNLHCAQTRAALLDCIVASVAPLLGAAPKKKIDWLNARFVPPPQDAAAHIDKWVELALHQDCDDDLVRWLVCIVGATVTERALEYGCCSDRWRIVLPILLSSLEISVDDEVNVVLHDGRLCPDQVKAIPPMFQAAGYTLRLGRKSWSLTASAVYRDLAHIAELRTILEPMLYTGAPTREELEFGRGSFFAVEGDAAEEHVAWINMVMSRRLT